MFERYALKLWGWVFLSLWIGCGKSTSLLYATDYCHKEGYIVLNFYKMRQWSVKLDKMFQVSFANPSIFVYLQVFSLQRNAGFSMERGSLWPYHTLPSIPQGISYLQQGQDCRLKNSRWLLMVRKRENVSHELEIRSRSYTTTLFAFQRSWLSPVGSGGDWNYPSTRSCGCARRLV